MGYGLAVIDDKTLRLDVVSYMDLNLLRLEVTSWFLLPHARPQRGSADSLSFIVVPTRATALGVGGFLPA